MAQKKRITNKTLVLTAVAGSLLIMAMVTANTLWVSKRSNDATNEARALLLLEANGIIELKEGVGLAATKNDIVKNPKNVDIREMEAALITGVLSEVDCAVINGNYAIAANLKVSDALAAEDSESAAFNTYANILVVKEGNENDPKTQALVEAILSDAVRDFINNTYDKAVVPVF